MGWKQGACSLGTSVLRRAPAGVGWEQEALMCCWKQSPPSAMEVSPGEAGAFQSFGACLGFCAGAWKRSEWGGERMGNPGRSVKGLHLVALSAPVAKLRIVQWSCQNPCALGPSWMALTGCLLVTVAWSFDSFCSQPRWRLFATFPLPLPPWVGMETKRR